LGAAAIVVVCAGGFPNISAPVPVLLPGRIVPAVVGSLARTRRIGLVLPNQAQVPFALARWREAGFEARPTWVSPVDEGGNFDRAVGEMQDPSLELVVLDCMGHDEAFRERFASRCGHPVLAAQTMVARIAAAMV
jgi:protein AroM